jgi:predicted CoA-substrate-specific enzyme activase
VYTAVSHKAIRDENLKSQLDIDTVHRLGIDAGSKTLKAVLLDGSGKSVYSTYRRHGTKILETLHEVIHDIFWREGNLNIALSITGSAGIAIAEALDAPFVQEVIATTQAVESQIKGTDAIVELGGEDAKIIYLTGGREMRMNATCAGGTGGFIDTIAFMLGMRPAQMSHIAFGYRQIHPIASRCAVFAQTDVRPLLNAGTPKADIAASVFEAVVRQTLGGLACGRPLAGKIVFLGGPIEHMSYLYYAFRRQLGTDAISTIKPADAHMFTCTGAALAEGGARFTIAGLEERLNEIGDVSNDLPRLDPLFENVEERRAYFADCEISDFERIAMHTAKGPLYLGVDAGSTTLKLALVDAQERIVYTAYEPARGSLIDTFKDMLLEMYAALPRPYSARDNSGVFNAQHNPNYPWIAGAYATGYGEALLRSVFGIDGGVVETTAHLRAARALDNEVTFVLDIGGQDMKALWVRDGRIADAVLNEACSSGCGSFLEGSAYSLKTRPERFSELALDANNPVDLGTKCTVFMTSRVRHAQKVGAKVGDIAAGIAYSVVSNALFKIIGADKVDSIGEHPVVSGGTFKSDAVFRALEKTLGREVRRSKYCHLMGAIGCALIAKDTFSATLQEHIDTQIAEDAVSAPCGLLTARDLKNLTFNQSSSTCEGCRNSCKLSIVHLGDGRLFISGNKCPKGETGPEALGSIQHSRELEEDFGKAPSAFEATRLYFQSIIKTTEIKRQTNDVNIEAAEADDRVCVGLCNTLDMYEYLPFWSTLLTECGFDVRIAPSGCENDLPARAWESVPSESACYAAKLTHARSYYLANIGVDAILLPSFERGNHCPVSAGYAFALTDNVRDVAICSPHLSSYKPLKFVANDASRPALYEALLTLATNRIPPKVGSYENKDCANAMEFINSRLSVDTFDAAIEAALSAQEEYASAMRKANEEVLAWVAKEEGRRCALLAGRPYHSDPSLLHDLDRELQRLGVGVLCLSGLEDATSEAYSRALASGMEKPAWRQAKRFAAAGAYALEHPDMELIFLQSFGCGFDAVAIEEVVETLRKKSKFAGTLKIDDIQDLAHIRIRLRTLFEAK